MVGTKRLASVIIVVFLLSLRVALADDSVFGGEGSNPMPMEDSNIEFVSEKVVLAGEGLEDAGETGKNKGRWKVTCDFTFRNTQEKPIKVKMGFPFPTEPGLEIKQPDGSYKEEKGDPLVGDFKTWIRGKQVKTKRQAVEQNIEKELYYTDAYIWETEFGPKETVEIKHAYTTGVSYNVIGDFWVGYALKTGGLWKGGKIGSAHIEIIPNINLRFCKDYAVWPEESHNFKPKGMKEVGSGEKRKFIWDLKNFHPTEDLNFCYVNGSGYVYYKVMLPTNSGTKERGKDLAKLSRKELRILRNMTFARHGRTFKDPALQKHFDKQWWYKQNPNYNDSMLTELDKEFVKKVSGFEKK